MYVHQPTSLICLISINTNDAKLWMVCMEVLCYSSWLRLHMRVTNDSGVTLHLG